MTMHQRLSYSFHEPAARIDVWLRASANRSGESPRKSRNRVMRSFGR